MHVGAGVSTTGAISATNGYISNKLGIGTSSPSGTLHVYGATSSSIYIGRAGAPNTYGVIDYPGSAMVVGTNGADGLVLRTNGTTRLSVDATGYFSANGNMGIGGMIGYIPSTTLHVSGTIRIANGGETCDTNRSGAIRYNGTAFQVCYGTGGWANLADASSTVATADRITSGTAQVIANGNSGYVSLTNGASTWGYLGVSQTYLGAANFGGKVGIGTVTPAVALEISGTVSATVLQLADGPAITCGPSTYGTMKMVNGRPYYCRQ
ncbi:hypothetical protein [Mesorhizobium carmichaelinearum]|uniref:hypothetical protein n=1 Tax=Mesorhizobium carmichaelinearum TaxID=1208188 RepID=UPI000BA30C55|nr:hypothetical protein [Mesorhizobium carmichaelinearum]